MSVTGTICSLPLGPETILDRSCVSVRGYGAGSSPRMSARFLFMTNMDGGMTPVEWTLPLSQ